MLKAVSIVTTMWCPLSFMFQRLTQLVPMIDMGVGGCVYQVRPTDVLWDSNPAPVVGGLMSYLCYFYFFVYSGVQYLRLVYLTEKKKCMLPVFLECPFVFSIRYYLTFIWIEITTN